MASSAVQLLTEYHVPRRSIHHCRHPVRSSTVYTHVSIGNIYPLTLLFPALTIRF